MEFSEQRQDTENSSPKDDVVKALESIVLDRVSEEAHDAAKAVPLKESHYSDKTTTKRLETLAEISELVPEAATEAIAAAAAAGDKYAKGRAFELLVPLAIRTDKVDECLEHLEDRFHQNEFLRKVAAVLMQEERFEEALATTSRISSVYTKSNILPSIADHQPDLAPKVHAALMDTANDPPTGYESDSSSSRCKALSKLAAHVPEAVEEAKALVDQTNRDTQIEVLARLSQHEPQLGVRAAEMYAELPKKEWMSATDREQLARIVAPVESAAEKLVEQGHLAEAQAMAALLPSRSREKLIPDIFDKALTSGNAEVALRISDMLPYERDQLIAKAKALNILDEPSKAEVVRLVRASGEKSALFAAASQLPELLPEAEALIEKLTFDSDKTRAVIGLMPSYIKAGRIDEAIEQMRGSDGWNYNGWQETMTALESFFPDTLPVALSFARSAGVIEHRASLLARLSPHSPEAAQEAVELFETQIAPRFAEKAESAREHRSHEGMPHEGEAISIAQNLGQAGYLDAALRVADGLVTARAYMLATIDIAHERPEVLSTLIANIEKVRSTEGFKVNKKFAELLERLPDNELSVVVLGLESSEQAGLRNVAAEAIGKRLIVAGQTDELLRLLPATLDAGTKELIGSLAQELVARGDLDSVRAIINRIDNTYGNGAYQLLPLLDSAPELANDAYRLINEAEKIYLEHGVMLGAIAPHLPEAIEPALEYLKTKSQKDYRVISSEIEKTDFGALAIGLIRAGRGGEVMDIINQNRELFKPNLIPALLDQGEVGIALQAARSMKSPVNRARALATIAMASKSEEDQRDQLENLIGPEAVDAAPHTRSDRSINYGYFASEMASNPLLVEAFVSRATSPAEVAAILRAVDIAATDLEAKDIQFQALQLLTRFGTSTVMSEYWREERQSQALGERKADIQGFKHLPNLLQLSRNLEQVDSQALIRGLLEKGYTATSLFEHPWLLKDEILAARDQFPYDGPKTQQHEWLADHAFVQLQGFNRRSIGQIIANRLANNSEYSLHDATQWLESFAVPTIRTSAHQKTEGSIEIYNPETGQLETRQITSRDDEALCLGELLTGTFTSEELRRLPGFASAGGEVIELKTQKFEQLFSDPAYTIIYAAALQSIAKPEDGKVNTVEVAALIESWAKSGLINEWAGRGKEILKEEDDLVGRALHLMRNTAERHQVRGQKMPEIIGRLKQVGQARKNYIDSTTTWLRTYQNLPAQKLQRVWGERQKALADGVPDTPDNIYEWSLSSGLRAHLLANSDDRGELLGHIPVRELLTRYRAFVPELVTRYDSESTTNALTRLWEKHETEADLPPYSIDLADGYTFKVFSKEDPAGMTIGYDTDCCMTLGGASESCIFAGYQDRRFGFVGLYDEQDKLVAQSFVWHNEGTLVLDNIEAQRGRNLERIQSQYRDALTEYLVRLHAEKPELGISQVNIGTGYLASSLSRGLSPTRTVPIPGTGYPLYSDADRQLELLKMTPEAIEQIAAHETVVDSEVRTTEIEPQPVRVSHAEMITVPSPVEGAQIISRIEAQVYPSELVLGHTDIHEDLQRPDNFSFLIGSRTGNSGVVGYVIAYHDEGEGGVYVSDLALLPSEQRAGYGVAAMDYLLEQISKAGEERVIFEARESTSYQALQTQTARDVLAKHGFSIASSERHAGHFDNGEAVYRIVLERTLP